MNTNHNSTTIPDEITARIAEAITAANAVRAQRDAAAEEACRQQAMQAHAKLLEGWDRPLTLIYQAVPEWAHAYVNEPSEPHYKSGDDYNSTYGWVEIALPGCTTIRAWADQVVTFEAGQAELECEDMYDTWYATVHFSNYRRSSWSMHDGERDFVVAVETAHHNHLMLLEFQAEAERRNAAMSAPAAPVAAPKPVLVEIPHDPAAKVLACIAELDLDGSTTFERGLLYGLITLAAELRAIRGGIDDIAAVVVANDPKENQQ